MRRHIPGLIDDINKDIAIVQYLAEKEDSPGLSDILLKVIADLDLIRCELEAMTIANPEGIS